MEKLAMDAQRMESAHSFDNQHGLATILLVDDIDLMRELAKKILNNYGYTVLDAKDGKTGLKIAGEYPGPIHILLADMFMPAMTGRTVAEHVLASRPGIKVLFMSGQSIENILSHGGLDPGFGLLRKPFSPESLLGKVSETLGPWPHD
jgi:CheY-like chemotaxis protein